MSIERHRRREFLLRALAWVGSPALLSACKSSDDAGDTPGPGHQASGETARLARSYFAARDLGSARVLGSAYLGSLEREESEDDIVATCSHTIALVDAADDDEAALSALEEAVREDFSSHLRSPDLLGWVLARTELELCALTLLP